MFFSIRVSPHSWRNTWGLQPMQTMLNIRTKIQHLDLKAHTFKHLLSIIMMFYQMQDFLCVSKNCMIDNSGANVNHTILKFGGEYHCSHL